MRALALDEIDSFLRSGGAENGEAHGVRHLHCRAANSPARAVHQDGFGSTRLRGVMQRMIRGPIGNPHSAALAKTDFFWYRMHLLFLRKDVFRVTDRNP